MAKEYSKARHSGLGSRGTEHGLVACQHRPPMLSVAEQLAVHHQLAMLSAASPAFRCCVCSGKGGSLPCRASSLTAASSSPHTSLAVHAQRWGTCDMHETGYACWQGGRAGWLAGGVVGGRLVAGPPWKAQASSRQQAAGPALACWSGCSSKQGRRPMPCLPPLTKKECCGAERSSENGGSVGQACAGVRGTARRSDAAPTRHRSIDGCSSHASCTS